MLEFLLQVPSLLEMLAAMERHSFLSKLLLLISARCKPVHCLTLSIHVVLGLPLPLVPCVVPSRVCFMIVSCLFMCPKYTNFLLLMFSMMFLSVFNFCSTCSYVFLSNHDILPIRLYDHISKASSFFVVDFFSVHVSAPYSSVDHT